MGIIEKRLANLETDVRLLKSALKKNLNPRDLAKLISSGESEAQHLGLKSKEAILQEIKSFVQNNDEDKLNTFTNKEKVVALETADLLSEQIMEIFESPTPEAVEARLSLEKISGKLR